MPTPTEHTAANQTTPLRAVPMAGSGTQPGARHQLSSDDMERAEKLRVLGEMVSGVIHDVNNMLGSILGRAQLVRMKTDVDEIKRNVEQIEMVASQAGETVKRLLEFTRQGHRSDMQAVNLGAVMADAIEVTRHRWETQAQQHGILYSIDTDFDADATVSGIHSELVDAVANMILNSLDAMPSGGQLHLAAKSEGETCKLLVADEGIGMTPDQIANVFSPFYTTKGSEGTGLGMAVVNGIVTRHGGVITVDSAPGNGTRITITMPYLANPETLVPEVEEAVDPGRRRVLLVDDDATILDVIGEALRGSGHDVHICDAGAAAIVAMEDHEFDVLITDLGMPGVNGWDVARRARQLDPPLPVIVISGWGASITQEQVQTADVNLILPKPFRLEQIRQAIATYALDRSA